MLTVGVFESLITMLKALKHKLCLTNKIYE